MMRHAVRQLRSPAWTAHSCRQGRQGREGDWASWLNSGLSQRSLNSSHVALSPCSKPAAPQLPALPSTAQTKPHGAQGRAGQQLKSTRKKQGPPRQAPHLPQAEYLRRSQFKSSKLILPILWAVDATTTTRPGPPCTGREGLA